MSSSSRSMACTTKVVNSCELANVNSKDHYNHRDNSIIIGCETV